MGQVTTLIEMVGSADALNDADTIYAREPWTELSTAISLPEPFSGDLPADARSLGLRYFLEVSIAKEFLVDWVRSIEREPALNEKCRRLIQYAIHDA